MLVLDSVYERTYTLPVSGSRVMPNALLLDDTAGKRLTEWMCELLMRRSYSFKALQKRKTVRVMKESLCYVAEGFDAERRNANTNTNNI